MAGLQTLLCIPDEVVGDLQQELLPPLLNTPCLCLCLPLLAAPARACRCCVLAGSHSASCQLTGRGWSRFKNTAQGAGILAHTCSAATPQTSHINSSSETGRNAHMMLTHPLPPLPLLQAPGGKHEAGTAAVSWRS
jgi:hypothetical protein